MIRGTTGDSTAATRKETARVWVGADSLLCQRSAWLEITQQMNDSRVRPGALQGVARAPRLLTVWKTHSVEIVFT